MIKWEDVIITTTVITIEATFIAISVAEIVNFKYVAIAGSIMTFVIDLKDSLSSNEITSYTFHHIEMIGETLTAVILGGGEYGRIPILPAAILSVATLPGALAADLVQVVKSPVKVVRSIRKSFCYDDTISFEKIDVAGLNAMAAAYTAGTPAKPVNPQPQ